MLNYTIAPQTGKIKLVVIHNQSFTKKDLDEIIQKEFPNLPAKKVIITNADSGVTYLTKKR